MTHIKLNQTVYRKIGQGILLLWVLFIAACSERRAYTSAEMQVVVDSLVIIRNPTQAILSKQLADSGYHAIQHPGTLDAYHYYDINCWYYRNGEQFDTALMYADSMKLSLEGLSGVEAEYAHALLNKGVVLKDKHRYAEALKEFYAAEVYAGSFLDTCSAAEIYLNIGTMLYEQMNYSGALPYLKRAEEGSLLCPKFHHVKYFVFSQSSMNIIGLCHERLGHYDSARMYYRKGIDFVRKRPETHPDDAGFAELCEGVLLGNLGNVELLEGQL
ncbi:MAG: tetratricopeptide repeat protein, partial [Bacteroidota bacterium]|nr:tetratricopeptide repeat protein [Bacteroidota bacterium]MDX5430478.1 tetratricopeptide repeat protein [Bacteroidota bacterium]MDX5469239.1 tetratricopeptide repeat protein [Bacteroidota bacterium]